ncbi:MAG: PKD domain-containing protein [Bacteroidetes bacterium]|nr:PKD domain-containing protein [Bacteroidota bacterium]
MRNFSLRLIFISGFLLLFHASLFAQCPDTQPVVIGPDVVRAGQTVTYMTYSIPSHTYAWSVPAGGSIIGSAVSNQVTVTWGNTPTTATISVLETNTLVPGCTAVQAQKTITVQPLLHSYFYYQFDPTGGCYYNIVNFTADPNVSVHPNDPVVTYTWDFGDGTGNHAGTAAQQYTFPITGAFTPPHTFPVKLTIQNPSGQTDEITDYVYVDPDKFKPAANITTITPPTPNCLYNQYTFSGTGSLPKPASNPDNTIKIKYCDWYIDGVKFFHSGDNITIPCSMLATYTFAAPGTYTISLTVTNTINCENTTSTSVTVGNTVPVASFSNTQACVNEMTYFTDNSQPSTGFITDWYWSWGDGSGTEHYSLSGTPPPVPVPHPFSDLNLHNVTLKIVNSNGCENTTVQVPVQAEPSPQANFGYPPAICTGDVVQFTNMSSPLTGSPIASYLWNFDDPSSASNTSTDPSPQHLFSGPGSYHVSLRVTNQNGCVNTKTLTTSPLIVNPHPDIDFTIAMGATSYDQIFTSIINPGQNVGNNVYWEFGDGQNGFGSPITHTYPGPGAYTVRCTATDMVTQCTNVVEHPILLGGPPAPCFTANPPNQCQNVDILFVPCSPGGLITTEDWDFGDGTPIQHFVSPNVPASPTHAYAAPGPYLVTRVLNQGTPLEAQFSLWVNIYDAPTASFIWFSDPSHMHQSQACDGQDVYFVDQSYPNSTPPGTIYQWLWTFDDPLSGPANTSNLQNPTHTFKSGKVSYNVTLQVWENLQNCPSPVKMLNVPINTPIPVTFSSNNNVCVDQSVNFTTDPLTLPPANYTWLWDFGDGNTDATPGNVSHLYASVGDYTVTLTLTDVNGCSKSYQAIVTIIPKPIANFTFTTPTCFGSAIQFTDLSNVPLPYNDVIVGWDWDFGDGSAHSALRNPSHIYAVYSATGWDVILTVTTNRGCTQTKTINVRQIASPLADFQVTGGTYSCVTPQSVHFSDLSQTNGGGNLMSWSWDFGDPASGAFNFSTTQNPSHIYNTPGLKHVTLIVTNTNYCNDTIAHDITINALPVPDFVFSTPCLGNNMLFTDNTTPNAAGILSWAWDFGDGGTSPLQNPQHLFATAGAHLVTLVVVNSNGCTNTTAKTVTVNPKPIVDFISTSPFCQHAQVTFTSQAYVPSGFTSFINNWVWRFGDGSPTGSGPVVTHTYLDASISHTVTLITTTTDGCSDSVSKVITGIPAPIADFTYLGVGCLNQALSFVDNSQTNGGGTITQWAWNFDDPGSGSSNNSTLQNPTHSFTSAGIHHVSLTVTNVNGCATTKIIDVTISDKPVASFTAANSCLNNLTVFTDASSTPTGTIVTWAWDFGDGGTSNVQNPTYLFSTAGIHYVTLTVTNSNGCSHSVTNPIEVFPHPVTSFSFSAPTCAGNNVTFTDMSTTGHGYIVRRTWDFGDGNILSTVLPSITHQYATGGNYPVVLTVKTSDSCSGSKLIPVPIQFAPIASFTVTNSLCVLTPVQFNDNSQTNGGGSITQWNWTFGDPGSGGNNNSTQQNPVHNFSSAGTFWVHLNVSNADGCIGKDSVQVTINANPVADFTANSACQGNSTTFTDNSTSTAGTIVSWFWSFGDGGSSAAQNPTYTYATGGTFNVSLTVTTSNGCVHTVIKPVQVWAKPIVTFSYTSPTCAGSTVTFTDISTTSHGYVTLRNWDFGDGNTGSSATPTISHTYITGGNYQVKLTITTSDNCTDNNTISVPIQYNPISGFTWSSVNCALSPVAFTDISQQNGGGQITQWNWTFGDPGSGGNNISTQQNPTHSFTAAGSFTVHLKVTNASGCYKDSSATVVVNANPTALFTATSVCKGSQTVFTDNSSGGNIVTWSWAFGDGGTSTIKNPTYTYANSGTYNVVLIVTTDKGCVGTFSKPVVVYGSPVSQFSFSSPTCASDSVQFTDLSTTAHGSINKWEWTFGDGQSATIIFPASPNVKHKYANGGTYSVKLKITTTDNCFNEITIPVSVEYKPIANFSNDAGACASMSNQFHDLSQSNGGTPVVSWLWDFGDPTSGSANASTQQNPTHTFTGGGTFTIKLRVTNATGCFDTLRKPVTVNAAPTPLFSFDTACINSPTQFHDNSTSSSGTINAWAWTFGDPSSGANNNSTLQNPTHNYSAPGNYMVTLAVTTTNNCTKDTTMQIAVSPKPIALFQYTAACAQDSTIFTDLSVAPNSQLVAWFWDFGDGGTATVQNPRHRYATAGTFSVKEVVTNISGCKDSVTVSVIVHVKPVAAFQYTSKYCPKGQVTFQDMSTATGAVITDHLWIFEQGATSTVPNPVYTFPVTDTIYPVTLIVTDTYGCKDTVVDSVRVKPGFKFTFTNDTVCYGYPMHFLPLNQAQGDSLYSPRWNFGDPNSGPANNSNLYNTSHIFTAPGLYYVKLKVFNSDNCIDSVFKVVQVYALPKPHFSYIAPQCDSTLHFIDTTSNYGTGTIASWTWKFGDGSAPLIIPAPGPGDTSHIYSATGDYLVTLIITNTKGCTDSITQSVTRLPCIKADYNYPDTLRCTNYMVTFQDTSVPTSRIREWKWTWGDGQDTTYTKYSHLVKHKFTTAGTYTVKLRIKAAVNSVNIFDSITQSVIIHPTPQTLFSNIPVCLHQAAMFRDTSLTSGEPVSAWKWYFGEPTSGNKDTSSLRNPSHTYATRDTFNVKLVVMNKYGCKDSLTKPLRIYGLPMARFNYTAACTGDPTFFRDSSSIADTTIGFWRWKFGDLSAVKDTSLLKDPNYKYKKAGNYLVRLIVKDHFGCKDTVDSTITVHVTPVSAFTLIDGYEGTPGKVKLTNSSSGASGYTWDFGNGKTSNDTNPVSTYTEDGTYTIRLISTNQFGCADTTYYQYKILFRGLFVPNAFAPSSGNMAVRLFKPVGMNLKTYHIQVFDTWGHMLWESNKLDNNGAPFEGWDGTYNGEVMPQGNYFWKVTATFVDDSPWTGSDLGVKGGGGTMGTVILLR